MDFDFATEQFRVRSQGRTARRGAPGRNAVALGSRGSPVASADERAGTRTRSRRNCLSSASTYTAGHLMVGTAVSWFDATGRYRLANTGSARHASGPQRHLPLRALRVRLSRTVPEVVPDRALGSGRHGQRRPRWRRGPDSGIASVLRRTHAARPRRLPPAGRDRRVTRVRPARRRRLRRHPGRRRPGPTGRGRQSRRRREQGTNRSRRLPDPQGRRDRLPPPSPRLPSAMTAVPRRAEPGQNSPAAWN